MKYNELGQSGIKVSELCLGSMTWGSQNSQEDANRQIEISLNHGINFIDTAQYTLIQKRDSSYMKYDRIYRIDMLQEVVVIDTLGFASVKDSLFGVSDRYKLMAKVPIDGVDQIFEIKADVIDKNGYNVPVFEVRVSKDAILFDQNKDLLKQEKTLMSVDGVNGPDLVLGSMSEVSTNGNWPTTYDAIARN